MNVTASTSCALRPAGLGWQRRRAGTSQPGFVGVVVLTLFAAGAVLPALAQPFAATQAPGPLSETNATLNGMATPNGLPTVAWFEWGTNTSYGLATPALDVGDGVNVVRTSASIMNLTPAMIYWYRLVCSNRLGVVHGADRSFITGGKLTVWGSGIAAQTNTAKSFDRLVAITSGQDHNLALTFDGLVVAWGSNGSRQTNVPAQLGKAVGLAAGAYYSVALQESGTVVAWGNNSYNQTNIPAGLGNVVLIAAGRDHSLALKTDGTVVAWGEYRSGQTNVPLDLENVVGIAGCAVASLALKADGTVVAWGSGPCTNVPAGLDNVVAIAGGVSHGLALIDDGTLVAWGSGAGTNIPAGLDNVVAIASGQGASLALKRDGTVVAWGTLPPVPVGLSEVVAASAGQSHALVLRARTPEESLPYASTQGAGPVSSSTATLNGMATPNGAATVAWFEWGADVSYGQTKSQVEVGSGLNVVRISAPLSGLAPGGIYHFRLVASNEFGVAYGAGRVLTTGQKVAAWGTAAGGVTSVPADASPAVAVAGGHGHSLALDVGGTVLAWGTAYPDWGQTNVPAGLNNVVAVAGGFQHSLALKQDGTVSAWGSYALQRPVFVPAALTDVVAIAGGDDHSLALRGDGTVAAWGFGFYGPSVTNVPAGLNNVVAITAGASHSLALRSDGTVVAWGGNILHGETKVPTGLSQVVAIASSVWHSLALRSNGTVAAWGDNSHGQTSVPSGLSNVVEIAAGQYHSLALRSDGTIVAWGDNYYGQSNVPTGLNQVVSISCGDNHSLALAPNTPPQPSPYTFTGPVNLDSVVPAPCIDPNGDPLTFRVGSLPTLGSLYQYAPAGRGAPITAAGTLIDDAQGRVIFAPVPDNFGIPYDAFGVVANDGQYDSGPGTVTLDILPPSVMESGAYGLDASHAFSLAFAGLTNGSYSVWASTNLADWSRLGMAGQPGVGQFLFRDAASTNWPVRFYRVRSP
jgi:alpha-tubulin suppressor-like RCC1 family protein